MKTKIILFILVLAVIFAGASYYYISGQPRYCFYLAGKAIRNHDTEMFNKYVDVDSIVDEWVNWSCDLAKTEVMGTRDSLKNPIGEQLVELMIPNMRMKLKEEFKRSILENVENSEITSGLPLINMMLLPIEKIEIANKTAQITISHPKTGEKIFFKMKQTPARYWRITSIQVPSIMKMPARSPQAKTTGLPAQPPKQEMPAIKQQPFNHGLGKEIIEKKDQVQETAMASLERDYVLTKTIVYTEYYQKVREKISKYISHNFGRQVSGKVNLKLVILANGQLKEAKAANEKPPVNPKLKELAIKAAKDASPYPAFSQEMIYPETEVSITVSFEQDK
ncbi:MAG: TonB family protein [Candidatus Omnitrophica bacterium]|nr:TonB family protein [Candidatus Omnitrophota bacterium]